MFPIVTAFRLNNARMLQRQFVRFASTTEITASLVKELRERSGAPMMDCKKALMADNVNGDITKAIEYLRIKGLAKADSSARVAAEGLIGLYVKNNIASVVEVNCETDFVNGNKLFQNFVGTVAATANTLGAGNIDNATLMELKNVVDPNNEHSKGGQSMRDALGDVVSAIRENIVVRRAFNVAIGDNQRIGVYMHGKALGSGDVVLLGQQVGVILLNASPTLAVEQRNTVDNVAKKLAMHVVAAKPAYLNKDEVPTDVLQKETEICREQTAATSAGKKPEIVEKMILGKLAKKLGEICLLDQNHMAEEGNPVISKYLQATASSIKLNLSVSAFHRWHVGQLAK